MHLLPEDFLNELASKYELSPEQKQAFIQRFSNKGNELDAAESLNISPEAFRTRMTGVYSKFSIGGKGPNKLYRLHDLLSREYQKANPSAIDGTLKAGRNIDALVQESNNQPIKTLPEHMELDRKFFTKIRQILPSNNSILFLRNHDFAGSAFCLDHLKDLVEFDLDCEHNPEIEFLDADLEKLRANLKNLVSILLVKIGRYTSPVPDQNGKRFNRMSQDWQYKDWKGYCEAAEELNNLAKEVVSAYKEFVQQGRRKLGVE
jgi:hypothetical protein